MKTQHSLSIVKEFWYFSSKWCKAMWSCLTIIKYQCSRGMDKEKTILYIPLTTKSYNIFYVKSICGEKNPTGNLSRIQNNISLPEEISFMRNLHLQIGKKKTQTPNTSFLNTVCILQAKILKSEMSKEPIRLISETYLISCPSEILNNGKRRLEAKSLSVFLIIMVHPSSPFSQFLSSPLKHMQAHLGTIKREIAKNTAAHRVLPSLPLGTLALNPIL